MKKVCLYIAVSNAMGGSNASLYDLINSCKESVIPIVLFPSRGLAGDYFEKNGIECHYFPIIHIHNFSKNRFIDNIRHPWRWYLIKELRFRVSFQWYVWKMFKDRNVDIVHTNSSVTDMGLLAAKILRAKHIWHIRESLDVHAGLPIYRGKARMIRLINQADARIAISHFVAEKWCLQGDETYVIPDAIRSVNDILYVHEKQKYLLSLSYYLTEEKGCRTIMYAFASSRVWESGYRLKYVGNCEEGYKDELLSIAQKHGCGKYVDFLPCQSDVKEYFLNATAFIMASENEGLGRVTGEAMFYGCPVIAKNSGGTPDLVSDNRTGYLFETTDECSALIQKVCTSSQNDIISNAQDYAVRYLSKEVYGPRIMNIYDKLTRK